MRKDGFLKHLSMCENKKTKVVVVEVKSEECSSASEPFTTVSHAASSAEEMPVNDGCKILNMEDMQNTCKRKENVVEHLYPEKVRNFLLYYLFIIMH